MLSTRKSQLIQSLPSALSFVLSFLLLLDSWRSTTTSDGELIALFRETAFEDVFGFGFWPMFALLAALQLLLLCLCLWLNRSRCPRLIFALLLVVFAISSTFSYHSYLREFKLWTTEAIH